MCNQLLLETHAELVCTLLAISPVWEPALQELYSTSVEEPESGILFTNSTLDVGTKSEWFSNHEFPTWHATLARCVQHGIVFHSMPKFLDIYGVAGATQWGTSSWVDHQLYARLEREAEHHLGRRANRQAGAYLHPICSTFLIQWF